MHSNISKHQLGKGDVLHGVEINPLQSRTSLVVWFTDNGIPSSSESEMGLHDSSPPPWLLNPDDEDDIGNFVLASAIENIGQEGEDEQDDHDDMGPNDFRNPTSEAMTHQSRSDKTVKLDSQQFYFNSASMGNVFGLCRLGSICDDGELNASLSKRIPWLLQEINDRSSQKLKRDHNTFPVDNDSFDNKSFAKRLWFEAAIRGNPLAQVSLADAFMDDFMQTLSSNTVYENDEGADGAEGSKDLILMATVLFSLAAQQGMKEAILSLSRVMNLYVNLCMGNKEDDSVDEQRILDSSMMRTIIAAQAGTKFQA